MRLYAALFAIGLVIYGLFAWGRVWRQSGAPHFVYQADAWLHGEIAVSPPLPNDDWAILETVTLDDGREVSGRRLLLQRFRTVDGDLLFAHRISQSKGITDGTETMIYDDARQYRGQRVSLFHTIDGEDIGIERIRSTRGFTAFVSFPELPSVIMIPSVVFAGRGANDVVPTIFIAALILPLALLVLRRLNAAGLSQRTLEENLWLVATLAFGTVLFFSSVQGKVWFTAHVVGVALMLVYAWAAIEAKHPIVAGLALGAAALTRTSMAFMFPLFLFEAWRMAAHAAAGEPEPQASGNLNLRAGRAAMMRSVVRPLVRFAIPIVAFAIIGAIYNYVRFHSFSEFGHSYLALGDHQPVRQQVQIEQWGIANIHYLGRNLAVAFTLLPELLDHPPWIQLSGHGLAIWVTTPVFLLLLWPRQKNALHRPLWITTGLVALLPLLYMNSGWFQFGYRFSLDYTVLLIMLLAIGGRPLKGVAKALIVAGIVVNVFGAVTFDRYYEYYKTRGNAYDVVVPQ